MTTAEDDAAELPAGRRSNRCVVCMKPTGSIRKVYCSEHSWNSMTEGQSS